MHPDVVIGAVGLLVAAGSGVIAWLQLRRTPVPLPKNDGKVQLRGSDNDLQLPDNGSVGASTLLGPPFGRLPVNVVGRDHILQVLGDLASCPDGKVHVLTGMGGVGKSTVALKVCDRAIGDGYSVWWLSGVSAISITAELLGLAKEIGASSVEIDDVLAGRLNPSDVLWNHLRFKRRWLLVIDNADELEELVVAGRAAGDGNGWLRPAEHGLILVTSRTADPAAWGSHAQLHPLEILDEGDGARILMDLAPGAGAEGFARKVSLRLGGLPLALKHAGLYLSLSFVKENSFEKYLAGLVGDSEDLVRPLLGGTRGTPQGIVATTWDVSLTSLARRGVEGCRSLLLLLSVCAAPDAFPLRVIQTSVHAGVLPKKTLSSTLPALESVGLISLQHAINFGDGTLTSMTVHPLVAEGQRLTNSESEVDHSVRTLVKCISSGITELDRRLPSEWPVWRMLVPHVALALDHPDPERLGEETLNELMHIAARIISALAIASEHPKGEELVRHIRRYVAMFPERHVVSITARYCIVYAKRTGSSSKEGELEFRSILNLQRDLLGDDHPDTLHTRHNLAHTLAANGRIDEAIAEFAETISRRERTHGPVDDNTIGSRLALVHYLTRSGRVAEASREQEKTLRLMQGNWSDDHPVSLAVRKNLAKMEILEGRTGGLDAELQDILLRQRRVLGPDHLDTVDTVQSIAELHEVEGYLGQALLELQGLLVRQTSRLGDSHPIIVDIRRRIDVIAERV